jgi:type II secretory pathway component PulF
VLVVGIIASFISLPFWKGSLRVYVEKIPPWSFYRLQIGTSWLFALATLLSNGVTQTDCIKQMVKSSERKNPWLADRLKKTSFFLKNGQSLGPALDSTKTNFPDPEIIDDLLVYSELENFDEALFKIGREWVDEGLEKMDREAEVLSGVIKNIVYALVAWFAMGTIQIMNILSSAASSV